MAKKYGRADDAQRASVTSGEGEVFSFARPPSPRSRWILTLFARCFCKHEQINTMKSIAMPFTWRARVGEHAFLFFSSSSVFHNRNGKGCFCLGNRTKANRDRLIHQCLLPIQKPDQSTSNIIYLFSFSIIIVRIVFAYVPAFIPTRDRTR